MNGATGRGTNNYDNTRIVANCLLHKQDWFGQLDGSAYCSSTIKDLSVPYYNNTQDTYKYANRRLSVDSGGYKNPVPEIRDLQLGTTWFLEECPSNAPPKPQEYTCGTCVREIRHIRAHISVPLCRSYVRLTLRCLHMKMRAFIFYI